jgi:hypothetical protein
LIYPNQLARQPVAPGFCFETAFFTVSVGYGDDVFENRAGNGILLPGVNSHRRFQLLLKLHAAFAPNPAAPVRLCQRSTC